MVKYLGILFTGLIAISCSTGSGSDREVLSLAVSFPPQKAVLDYLTSDSIKVITAIPVEANPESWEPSMNDFVNLNDASVMFTTGQYDFENTIASSLNKSVAVVNSCEGVTLLYGTHNHDCNHNSNHGEHDGEVADPHVWTSTTNLKVMADNMTATLKTIDPEFAGKYDNNLNRFHNYLDSIDDAVMTRLQQADSRSFLIWHPSLSYMARDYSLNQIALGEENKELSVTQMKEKIDKANASRCKVIFIQANYDSRQAENVANQLGLSPVAINPVDYNWETQFNKIIDAITN